MRVVKPGWLSGRLAINQPFRPLGVELHHPVANIWSVTEPSLAACPARAFVNRRHAKSRRA